MGGRGEREMMPLVMVSAGEERRGPAAARRRVIVSLRAVERERGLQKQGKKTILPCMAVKGS